MSLMDKASNIQDMWLIEENAIIFLRLIILIPPRAPIIADSMDEIIIVFIKKKLIR